VPNGLHSAIRDVDRQKTGSAEPGQDTKNEPKRRKPDKKLKMGGPGEDLAVVKRG
jgi:hypothetical protein